MGSITKSLFGGGDSKSTSSQQSGFNALPASVQASILGIINPAASAAVSDPSQFFAPMGITSEEEMARALINPENLSASIETYLNPYRGVVQRDVNRAFEDEFGAAARAADEAGAFGSSRYRDVQGDLEETRLRAIEAGLANQYNTAFNQMQVGIGNLLGFGGLERGIDLSTRQAPIAASQYALSLYDPLIRGAGTSTQTQTQNGGGLLGGLGSIGGFASGLGAIGLGLPSFSSSLPWQTSGNVRPSWMGGGYY